MRLLSASLARCAAWATVAVASAGCSAPDREPRALAARADAIVNGAVSPAEQDAVVAIQYPDGSGFTGVVVAPTLVLTARHAVVTFADSTTAVALNCVDPLQGAPVDHNLSVGDLSVHVGSKTPLQDPISVIRIFSGASLDLCESDVALLELGTALDVPPLPLRLERETMPGETGTLIGWGQSELDAGARRFIAPHGARRQVQLTIEAVGPGALKLSKGAPLPVPESWFVTGPGACYGDSGAPFISQETGAVIGIWSTLELQGTGTAPWTLESCLAGRPAYRRLAADQYSWLKDAFRAAGQAPWYEGRARPAVTGSSCLSDEECLSRLCLHAKSGSFCSQSCATAECPAAMTCVVQSDEPATPASSVCVLDELDVPSPDEHGCSASSASHARGGVGGALLLAALSIWKRSRRTRRSLLVVTETRRIA